MKKKQHKSTLGTVVKVGALGLGIVAGLGVVGHKAIKGRGHRVSETHLEHLEDEIERYFEGEVSHVEVEYDIFHNVLHVGFVLHEGMRDVMYVHDVLKDIEEVIDTHISHLFVEKGEVMLPHGAKIRVAVEDLEQVFRTIATKEANHIGWEHIVQD